MNNIDYISYTEKINDCLKVKIDKNGIRIYQKELSGLSYKESEKLNLMKELFITPKELFGIIKAFGIFKY